MSWTVLESLNTEMDPSNGWSNHTEDTIPLEIGKQLEVDGFITQDQGSIDRTNNQELDIKNKGDEQSNYQEGVDSYKIAGGRISFWDSVFLKIVPDVLNPSSHPTLNSNGHPISGSVSTQVNNSVNVSSNVVSVVDDITHQSDGVMVAETEITNVLPFYQKPKVFFYLLKIKKALHPTQVQVGMLVKDPQVTITKAKLKAPRRALVLFLTLVVMMAVVVTRVVAWLGAVEEVVNRLSARRVAYMQIHQVKNNLLSRVITTFYSI